MPFRWAFLPLALVLTAACSSESSQKPHDAGDATQPPTVDRPDARTDTDTDASSDERDAATMDDASRPSTDGAVDDDAMVSDSGALDAAMDSSRDDEPDAAADSSTDSGPVLPDATVDPQTDAAAADSGTDAELPLDATVDPQPDAASDSGAVDSSADAGPIDPCPEYLLDADGDGYGDPSVVIETCMPLAQHVLLEDCDDTDEAHWADCETCLDDDDDGYGVACDLGTDCDDGLAAAHSGAIDQPWNGIDEDCDGDLGLDIARIGSHGGWARSALFVEGTLIAGVGSELHFYDALDLSEGPYLELPLPAPATQLQLHDGLLYAALAGRGLARLDVSSMASPELIDIYSHPRMRNHRGAGFELAGGRITLCDASGGFTLITIANITPDGLRRHGFWAGASYRGGEHCDVVTVDDTIWAATDSGITYFGTNDAGIIDSILGDSPNSRWPQVGDGQTHVWSGNYGYPPYEQTLTYRSPVSTQATSQTFWRGRAWGALGLAGGRAVVRVREGDDFDCLTTIALDSHEVAPCALMTESPEDIASEAGEVVVAHGGGLSRFALDDETGALTAQETVELLAHPIQITIDSPYAFVVDEQRGVHIFETQGASTLPRHVGALPLQGFAAVDLVVRDGVAYQRELTRYGFEIVTFDVSDPAAPIELDRHEVIPGHWATNVALHLHASTLYASDGADLFVFDVTDPSELRELPSPTWTSWVNAMASYGDELVVLTDTSLARYDTTVPEAPALIAALPSAQALRLAVSGGMAVMDDIVVDLESMTVLSEDQEHRTYVHSVRAFGTRAYLTDVNGVRVIDFSDPEDVRRAELYRGRELIGTDLAMAAGALYVVGRDQGLTMFSSPDAALP